MANTVLFFIIPLMICDYNKKPLIDGGDGRKNKRDLVSQ